MGTSVGRNDPCPCGSGTKYKRCCLDADKSHSRASNPHAPADAPTLQLLIETPDGLLIRQIPHASPLSSGERTGPAAEIAVHDAAAIWGMPDFVHRGVQRAIGSGVRELGDNLLVLGRRAVLVQVKSREAPSSEAEREASWAAKQMTRAAAQARGSIRQLKREPARFENGRGRSVEVDGNAFQWLSVVVLDHPNLPDDIEWPSFDESHPVAFLVRRDWEFLFSQLKSTTAVIEYLLRVVDDGGVLGDEPARYYELALADSEAEPEVLPRHLMSYGAWTMSEPLLPLAGEPVDENAHRAFRNVLEDFALSRVDEGSEGRRVQVLAELDRLAVRQRENLGRFFLSGLEEVRKAPRGEFAWKFRRAIGRSGDLHVAVAVCSEFSADLREVFGCWVELRHHEFHERAGRGSDALTAGVLLTPRHDGKRPFDTTVTAVMGDLALSRETLAGYRRVWKSVDDAQRPAAA